MRVLMVMNRYLPAVGGAELQAAALIERLRGRGHEVAVVTRRIRRELAQDGSERGVPVRRLHPIGLSHRANALIVPRMIAYLVTNRRRWDIWHVHNIGPLGLAAVVAGTLTGTPVVLKAPGAGGIQRADLPGTQPSTYTRLLRRYLLPDPVWRAILRRAGAIVAISQAIHDEGRDFKLGERMVLLPNGVDTGRFYPLKDTADRLQLRAALDIPVNSRVIVFSGRLVRSKRVDLLLQAAARLREAHPNLLLLIAGSGAMQQDSVEAELHQLHDTLGLADSVRFLGRVGRIEQVLRAADLFAFPSVSEGLPNVVLEAMATRLPVVACRIGGVTDLLDDSSAWLVPPGDLDAFSAALDAALRDPADAAQRADRAYADVQASYTLDRVTDAYLSLYESLRQPTAAAAR